METNFPENRSVKQNIKIKSNSKIYPQFQNYNIDLSKQLSQLIISTSSFIYLGTRLKMSYCELIR